MKKKDQIIYVSIVAYGQWDENAVKTIYVGEDYQKAKESISEFKFPDAMNNFGWIEHWINEKNIKDEDIITTNIMNSVNLKP